MIRPNSQKELVMKAAQEVSRAADELSGAIKEKNVSRIWASNDRLRMESEALKTELAILQRLAPEQEV